MKPCRVYRATELDLCIVALLTRNACTHQSQRIPGSPFLVVKLALPDGRDVSSLMVSKGLARLCSPKRPNKYERKNKVEKSPVKDEPLKDVKYVMVSYFLTSLFT